MPNKCHVGPFEPWQTLYTNTHTRHSFAGAIRQALEVIAMVELARRRLVAGTSFVSNPLLQNIDTHVLAVRTIRTKARAALEFALRFAFRQLILLTLNGEHNHLGPGTDGSHKIIGLSKSLAERNTVCRTRIQSMIEILDFFGVATPTTHPYAAITPSVIDQNPSLPLFGLLLLEIQLGALGWMHFATKVETKVETFKRRHGTSLPGIELQGTIIPTSRAEGGYLRHKSVQFGLRKLSTLPRGISLNTLDGHARRTTPRYPQGNR